MGKYIDQLNERYETDNPDSTILGKFKTTPPNTDTVNTDTTSYAVSNVSDVSNTIPHAVSDVGVSATPSRLNKYTDGIKAADEFKYVVCNKFKQKQVLERTADGVSKDIGKKISPKKRDFALLKAIEPDMTNTDIAKQIANTKHPTQDGYKLAVDPGVQALVEKYQEVMQFSRFKVDPEFIKSGWMKEVLEAKDSRDRRGALDSLAKSEGMFKEIVEHHNFESDQEFLKKLETELGTEAAKIAAIELGLQWDE